MGVWASSREWSSVRSTEEKSPFAIEAGTPKEAMLLERRSNVIDSNELSSAS